MHVFLCSCTGVFTASRACATQYGSMHYVSLGLKVAMALLCCVLAVPPLDFTCIVRSCQMEQKLRRTRDVTSSISVSLHSLDIYAPTNKPSTVKSLDFIVTNRTVCTALTLACFTPPSRKLFATPLRSLATTSQMSPSSPERHIVIVGGGIIGSTSAYFLSRHPSYDPSKHKITLLEASKIAGGASGKAGGLLALWAYPSSIVPLSYRLHKELSDLHGGEERWGYRALHCGQIDCIGRQLKAEDDVKGKDGEMDGKNATAVNRKKEGQESVSLQKRDQKALGKLRAVGVPGDLDWVDAGSVRGYDDMGDPSTTAQVHPYQFTNAMIELAQEKGVEVKINSPVSKIVYSDDGKEIKGVTYQPQGGEEGTIEATDVVIAAGPWTSRVLPAAPISALRAHSVTIRPTRPVSAYALFTQIELPANFGHTNESTRGKGTKRGHKAGYGEQIVSPEIYARPKNEVYACGEGDRLVRLPERTDDVAVDEERCQDIMDYCASISDELGQGEITARQACYLPNVTAGSGHPLIGPTGVRGEVLAAGHTCWGIQNSCATGKIVSELVFDGKAKSANIMSLDPRNVL